MTPLRRKFVPPTAALMAFEAAARHQSFTAAATELHLTQGAVSRQIRSLEQLVGVPLFVRERQTVRLNEAGQAYAKDIRQALGAISSATLGLRANPGGGALNLAILPTFGTRWLAPRLPRFLAAHPGITLHLATRLAPFDLGIDGMDAAIHFGPAQWPGARLDFLMNERVLPVCSPGLRRAHRLARPRDLVRVALIHVSSRPGAWERWFDAQGQRHALAPGMVVDQFALATQAAMAGLGVALLPEFLIEAEREAGTLVVAAGGPMQSAGAYYLASTEARAAYPPLQAFRSWITQEARADGRDGASAAAG